MRVASRLLLAVALAGGGAEATTPEHPHIPAGAYAIDKSHASLVAVVSVLGGVAHYRLGFPVLGGAFAYDPSNWRRTSARIVVDPRSPDIARSPVRREMTRYFEPDRYPTITFVSHAVTGEEDVRGTMSGDLTLHGASRPVTLHVTLDHLDPGQPDLGTRVRFSGTGHISRSDFGMKGGPIAGDKVALVFTVEFVRR